MANSEPILLDAVLYQLGAQPVRRQQRDACSIVTLSSCVVKLLAYKDQLEITWEQFVRHPMRHLFSKIPPLQPCDDESCMGHCEAWHKTDDCALDSPLMEVWGKQWLQINFVAAAPESADLFTVHLRLPACLATQVQTYSGGGGVYAEPKNLDGKTASTDFVVLWMPRMEFQEIQHLKMTTPHVLGVARHGNRYGIRCKVAHAEQVHSLVRPNGCYLPPGRKDLYLLGPLPFGTVKESLVSLLSSIQWKARPMQPVAAGGHISGVMWKIQSGESPPVSLVATDKGDVLITKLNESKPVPSAQTSAVAANRTLELCSAETLVDPLQVHDPWAAWPRPAGSHPPAVAGTGADPVKELEKNIVAAVMAQLPRESMEVDSSLSDDTGRVGLLEQQVKELRDGQQGLHSMLQEQSRTQSNQIQVLQQQTAHLEHAVADHGHSLTHFQTQFTSQMSQQESRLDSLFRQQMDRLEEMLSKRARLD